jgi:hypothetical protein
MRHTLLAIALLLPLTAAAQDISKVNGSVSVDSGQHAGDVSTVNGAVDIADNAVVQKASTVNGSIELGDKAQATAVETVNGEITLGRDARISHTVEATNGSIHLAQNADVSGRLSNVNGAIALDAAHVGGGIETVSGDINVGANSRVEGGILVNESHSFMHWGNDHLPHIVIGPHAVVQGTLEFHRQVMLQVSNSAQIGVVKGATPVAFSGAAP